MQNYNNWSHPISRQVQKCWQRKTYRNRRQTLKNGKWSGKRKNVAVWTSWTQSANQWKWTEKILLRRLAWTPTRRIKLFVRSERRLPNWLVIMVRNYNSFSAVVKSGSYWEALAAGRDTGGRSRLELAACRSDVRPEDHIGFHVVPIPRVRIRPRVIHRLVPNKVVLYKHDHCDQ